MLSIKIIELYIYIIFHSGNCTYKERVYKGKANGENSLGDKRISPCVLVSMDTQDPHELIGPAWHTIMTLAGLLAKCYDSQAPVFCILAEVLRLWTTSF